MDGTAKWLPRNTPAVRDFHGHEERVAELEAEALAADFGDEFACQYV